MAQLVPCLLRYGLYQFGQITFQSGRITPYTVRLPQPPIHEIFGFLAEAAWDGHYLGGLHGINCIGIAKSGIPLAKAIYEFGLEFGKHTAFSIVDPHETRYTANVGTEDTTPLLIDNAVTTGQTAAKALGILRRCGHQPEAIIRIFDREDVGEDGMSTAERVKTSLGLELISILCLRDILPHLSPFERDAVLAYQAVHGTASFQEWLGGQHVL